MTVLELKEEISRLSKRGRQEIYAYLVRLKHETPEWKRAAARRIRHMRKGRVTTAEQMATRLRFVK